MTRTLIFAFALLFSPDPPEIRALLPLIDRAPDPALAQYGIARIYAQSGDPTQTIAWLKKATARYPSDPSTDDAFSRVREQREFQAIVASARKANPPLHTSTLAFTIAENDLVPEGLAWDPLSHNLYLGSVAKSKIVELTPDGKVRDLAREPALGSVVGMKVDARTTTLWANAFGPYGTGVFHFDLRPGKLIRKYVLPRDLLFNDLVVNSRGDVFVTATFANFLYWISHETDTLAEFMPGHKFTSANGIALSPDERTLFVASFPDGVSLVEIAAKTVRPIGRPAGASLSLANIDGLYVAKGSLLAIQNGVVATRVVRFRLNRALDGIEREQVLERGEALDDLPTTGAVASDTFYYIANSQLYKYFKKGTTPGARFDPVRILKVGLRSCGSVSFDS